MKKNEWQPLYEKLRPFFEDAARTHYREGDVEKGFKFWAVSEVLTDSDLSDDQIRDELRLDGSGDLGVDALFEDEDSNTLILVQSKFHGQATAIGSAELNGFFNCLTKVLNPNVVVASHNPLVADAHTRVREAINRGWTLRFVFVTSGYLSPEGRVFADGTGTTSDYLDGVPLTRELEVYDLEGLWNLYDSHLSATRFNTDVTLQIPPAGRAVSEIAGFRVLLAVVTGRELVKAFHQHKYALFRLNPRGPLQNKVNAAIATTLKDPQRRKLFFHLNNGITAVCDSFREGPGSDEVTIRDFQIVNGCQTTVTLAKASPVVESDLDIRVLVRVIEGLPGLRDEVATATNTQARLTAQDFKSNDPRQKRLKKEFDAMPAPIFYEIKRGDWDMEQNKARYIDPATGAPRRIKMKDIAQATLAFLGEPGDAKDKSREIFETQAVYQKVFAEDVTAQQLLLPWLVYERARQRCESWTGFAGAPYARFCLVALVGSELAPDGRLPSASDAARMMHDTPRIDSLLTRGQGAVASLHAALKDYPGHREFFRSAEHFKKVRDVFKELPDQW